VTLKEKPVNFRGCVDSNSGSTSKLVIINPTLSLSEGDVHKYQGLLLVSYFAQQPSSHFNLSEKSA